ncbi:hypothetical protein C0J52_12577 [Blattella germanica]|nr:hypothetical protein C0J52_12577 [Blattella germanica]
MIALRRRERSSSKITTVPKSYEKVSRGRGKKPYNSHGQRRCAPRPAVRLSSVGGKHGRVAALTSVTARPSVQDGSDCVLTEVPSMADNNTGKRGLQGASPTSRGRGITLTVGIRQQLLANTAQSTSDNAATSGNRTTTHESSSRRTKKKTSRHSSNARTTTTSAQPSASDISDSDVTSLSVRPAAEGRSHSDQEETVDPDPEIEELARLRCPSECTEIIAERETRRRQRRCADYPGFAFGTSIFGSDTLMKFNIIRNELQNIKNSQLKRVSTHG